MSSGREARPISASAWLAAFGACYAVLDLVPSFLATPVTGVLTVGDVVNLAAPFAVVGLVGGIHGALRREAGPVRSSRVPLATGVLAGSSMLYLNGEGMHVAANAVTRQLGGLEASPAWRASYFFDEVFSHVVSDVGLIGISLAVLALAARLPSRRAEPAVAAAAIPFGFAWFADGVEGGTVALMLPAALVALATILVRARGRPAALARNPVLLFYGTAFSLAGVLFLAWRLWQGGFPEFSQLGWV